MSRSRFLLCASGAGLCATSAFAGLAYNLGSGQYDKALVGGAFIGTCCLVAVSAVWAASQFVRPRAAHAEPGAAADGGGM